MTKQLNLKTKLLFIKFDYFLILTRIIPIRPLAKVVNKKSYKFLILIENFACRILNITKLSK